MGSRDDAVERPGAPPAKARGEERESLVRGMAVPMLLAATVGLAVPWLTCYVAVFVFVVVGLSHAYGGNGIAALAIVAIFVVAALGLALAANAHKISARKRALVVGFLATLAASAVVAFTALVMFVPRLGMAPRCSLISASTAVGCVIAVLALNRVRAPLAAAIGALPIAAAIIAYVLSPLL
jgi:magnesium-transporting ATPase (P-type)